MPLPRPRFTVRRLIVAVAVAALILGSALRLYREVMPAGAEFIPYWFASVEGRKIESPYDWQVIYVTFHDAGATHSGYHWTWLIYDDWLTGRRVIAGGNSLPDVRYGKAPLPVRWLDPRTFEVQFVAGPWDSRPIWKQVRLP